MSLEALKGNSNLNKLLQQAKTETKKETYGDDRLWKSEVDKSGNGFSVIRFLPAPEGEDLPWVKLWNHAFKGPTGQWYIENSLTTIGKDDPVSEYNTSLWNSGIESDKNIARTQKRKLQYYANILVVSDPNHPENNGKVFLYRFGKKIFDKVMEAMQPQFEDESPINPFAFWKGANFKLKIRKVEGYWNYDKSEFDTESAIEGDDEQLEALWKKQYSLADFVADKNFKSYDDLKKRLDTVLSGKMKMQETIEDDATSFKPAFKAAGAPEAKATESDDAMSYFEKLASS